MAHPASFASLSVTLALVLFTASLHHSAVARAQEDAGVCRTQLVNGNKSDSSLVGPYHNFSVSCINDSFALLNVRETGKRDYKTVTVEMKCTNEILNISYSRVLLYQYNPMAERNISVHYDTNLEPGTVCVFSGCVKTGPAENHIYKFNIQEATCHREMDLFSSSATSDSSTSIMLPSSSPDFNPSSTGISDSSTSIMLPSSSPDFNPSNTGISGSSSLSRRVITSSVTATGTILPTVTPPESGSAVLALIFILSAGILIIFGISVVVPCGLFLAHKIISRKNMNDVNFTVDFEMGIDDIHHFMLDDISIAESVATIIQPLHPPMPVPKHCSLMLSSTDIGSNRKGSVSVDEAAIKEIQLNHEPVQAKPIVTPLMNITDSKSFICEFQPPSSLHTSKGVVTSIRTEGSPSETKTPSTAYGTNTRHCVAPTPSLSSDIQLAANREQRYSHTLPSASTVPNNEALNSYTQETLRSSINSNGYISKTTNTCTYSPCDQPSGITRYSSSNQSLTKGSVSTSGGYIYAHNQSSNEQENTQSGSPHSYSTVSSTNNNGYIYSDNCQSPASSTNETHTNPSIEKLKDNNYTYSSTLTQPSLIKGISGYVSNVLTEGHTRLASSGNESLYGDSSCEGHARTSNRYDSDYVSESDYVSDSSYSSTQMVAVCNV